MLFFALVNYNVYTTRRGKQLHHKAVVNDLTTLEYIDEVAIELAYRLMFENTKYPSIKCIHMHVFRISLRHN